MLTTPSHHTFHRLNRLITTFLAQVRQVPAPVENPVSAQQPDTDDQSNTTTDSTQVAPEPTIDQAALVHQPIEPSSGTTERDDGDTKNTFVSVQEQFSGASAAEYAERSRIRGKKAFLVINARAGHNVTRIADVLAVLSAAGWKTGIAVKQYGGHTIELATTAAEQGYDLIIAYGGDGTINHVVNGVMDAKGKGRRKAVGVIPGGTANQWAAETSVPVDPIKAALALIDSDVRTVDLGRVQVQETTFPDVTQESRQHQQKRQQARRSKAKQPSSRENYFLLTAGLGIDASVIDHTSKELKQRVGLFAYDLALAESLPELHPFPIKITIVEDGQDQPVSWRGEAFQVILGNTRRYANMLEFTPDVHLDDGKLELCVITEGNTITTLQQISSLLFQHNPDTVTARHFLATHFLITVPASIHMHLDGSAVELEDYLSKSDRKALHQEQNKEHVMVTYRFDAVPHALHVTFPQSYDNALFEHAPRQEESSTGDRERAEKDTAEQPHDEPSDLVKMLQEQGYKVKITGVATLPNTSIIAGSTVKRRTGETRPVAVRIDDDTIILLQTGEHAPLAHVQKLQDGAVIIAHGKKSRRGVIKAKHVVLLDS